MDNLNAHIDGETSYINVDDLNSTIIKNISLAYQWLFKIAINCGHWEEVRSTAIVGIIMQLREPINSPWIECIKEWLFAQQKPYGTDMATWGEELWDTSMALIALNRLGVSYKEPHCQKAIRWMISLYNKNGRYNWHDEPWETSWSALTLIDTGDPELLEIAKNSAKWIASLQDSNGKIISSHYTAYYIIIGHNLLHISCNIISEEEKLLFSKTVMKAKEYLIKAISEDILWSGEPWSNGQILWALSSCGYFPIENYELTKRVVNWFSKYQDKNNGNWDDVEDTASSVYGLYFLLKQIKSRDGHDHDIRRELLDGLKTYNLQLKRKLIDNFEDGYIAINISPGLRRYIYILIAAISAGTVVITYLQFFTEIKLP